MVVNSVEAHDLN